VSTPNNFCCGVVLLYMTQFSMAPSTTTRVTSQRSNYEIRKGKRGAGFIELLGSIEFVKLLGSIELIGSRSFVLGSGFREQKRDLGYPAFAPQGRLKGEGIKA